MKKTLAIFAVLVFSMISVFAINYTAEGSSEIQSKGSLSASADLSLTVSYDTFAGQKLGFSKSAPSAGFGTDPTDLNAGVPAAIATTVELKLDDSKKVANKSTLHWYYQGINKTPLTLTLEGAGLTDGDGHYINITINGKDSNDATPGTFVTQEIATGFQHYTGPIVVSSKAAVTAAQAGKTWTTILVLKVAAA